MSQGTLFNDLPQVPETAEYDAFVEKFKPKKTTDDCYTPANIYDTVADWVAEEYNLDRRSFVRPFYPGGDYERFEYPAGCCVVDNPPFSILSQLTRFYILRGIKFFLFAPSMTCFNNNNCCAVVSYCEITYENGAQVRTSFLTNLDDAAARSAPVLYQRLKEANAENWRACHTALPRYEYPAEVLTAAKVGLMSQYGIDFRVPRDKVKFIRAMDSQRAAKKTIFGAGYLLSAEWSKKRAAAQAAQEANAREAITKATTPLFWPLSDRERAICNALDE